MSKDLLVLADEYAAATATFARALALKDEADSMSPIAREAGDKRAVLAEALAALDTAIAAARVQENERCLAMMDAIGCDWRDAGDMAKFYATNYLREAIRALLGEEAT